MKRALVVFALLGMFGCSTARGTCHSDGDCVSSMHCVSSRCVANGDAGRDGGSVLPVDAAMGSDAAVRNDAATITDAGHDAAILAVDAGHDAAIVPVDAGHDAAVVARDAGTVTSGIPLLFSEYIEGSSNNKALEIANLGSARYDLTQCHIDVYSNGNTTAASFDLTGSLSAGSVFTLCNSGATGFSPTSCTVNNGGAAVSFNGNDAIALVCESMTVDVIGQIGFDPGAAGWGTTTTTTNQTLRRDCSVTMGDTNGSDAFDPATEWTSAGSDVFDGLGTRGCP